MGAGEPVISIRDGSGLVSVAASLTERQTKIVELIAAGYTDKQLASRLGMAPSTLRTHLERMLRRFGVHSSPNWPLIAIEPAALVGYLRCTLRSMFVR
jgi:DNA-binding CsgD family transcriptional regulator